MLCTVAPVSSGQVWPTQVEQLLHQVTQGDLAQRRQGIRTVRDNYGPAMEPLVRAALTDVDAQVRRDAAELVATRQLPLAATVMPWLSADDADARLVAARVLERVVEPTAQAALIAASRDPNVSVRRAVVRALWRYSGEQVLVALLVALGDTDSEVRQVAVQGLARSDEPRVLTALTTRASDVDDKVRESIVRSLAGRGEPNAVAVLRQGLRDQSASVRAAAAWAIAMVGERSLVPIGVDEALLRLVSDDEPQVVVSSAVQALIRMPGERRAEVLLSRWVQAKRAGTREVIELWAARVPSLADQLPALCLQSNETIPKSDCLPLYGRATRDVQPLIAAVDSGRIGVRAALAALTRTNDPWALDWVLGQLDSGDESIVVAACAALNGLLEERGSGHALDPLVAAFGRATAAVTKRALLRTIGKTRSSRAWSVLQPMLAVESSSVDDLNVAIEAAGYIAHLGVGARLVRLLDHPQREVARAAARVLFEMNETNALATLLDRLERGVLYREEVLLATSGLLARATEAAVLERAVRLTQQAVGPERDAFLEGLARNPNPAAQDAVARLLRQGNRADRAKIAEAAAGGNEACGRLARLAVDLAGEVRANAIWSLGRVGGVDHLALLRAATKDAQWDVRANALVALGRVGGRSGTDVQGLLCQFVDHRNWGLREAALLGLYAAGQRCSDGSVHAHLLDDPIERVRIAAARVLSVAQQQTRPVQDVSVLRWCQAFDPSNHVRSSCAAGAPLQQFGVTRQDGMALVFASSRERGERGVAGAAVSLLRSDGLVRYARLDRRGSLFEPDAGADATRLLAPIAGDQ